MLRCEISEISAVCEWSGPFEAWQNFKGINPRRMVNLETPQRPRILSGMRPTGKLHLGNLVGALQNWVKLQDEYDSFHFVADWHMLTTGYENTLDLRQDTWEMVSGLAGLRARPRTRPRFLSSRACRNMRNCTCSFPW